MKPLGFLFVAKIQRKIKHFSFIKGRQEIRDLKEVPTFSLHKNSKFIGQRNKGKFSKALWSSLKSAQPGSKTKK